MAKHELRADRRRKAPKSTIQAAPTVYEITKPVGSAERFLDDAAKAALAAAAAGGLPSPKQFIPGAIRAVAKEAEKYPDPLLAEAARLPREELMRRAAHAEAYQKAMEAQNEVVRTASTALSPAGNMVANQVSAAAHDALTRQDAKGGDAAGSETAVSETPVSVGPGRARGGTRIVINPQVFKDKRDALCVAMNEGFRILMEANGFDPVSEPTEEQRRFFADTEYARDENMLRRTILARILTFDTSVTDPTESQLQEGQEFLQSILEAGLVRTQWEQWAVRRIASLLFKVAPSPSSRPTAPADGPVNADAGGGDTEEEKKAAAPVQEPSREAKIADTMNAIYEIAGVDKTVTEDDVKAINDKGGARPTDQLAPGPEAGGAANSAPRSPADAAQEPVPTGTSGSNAPESGNPSTGDSHREAIVAANGAELEQRAKAHVAAANRTIASLDQHIANADALGKTLANLNKSTDQILAQGERILAESDKGEQERNAPAPDGAGQAPKDLSKFDETKEEHAQALKDAGHDPAAVMGQAPAPAGQAPSKEAPGQTSNDGKLHGGIDRSQLGQDGRIGGGIDRSQFGQNGRIGIAARIVDPVTGKSRSSLSMNGPAIKPARAIGDMGARALTDTKRMNGPAIQPKRRIGESIKAPEVQEEELMKKRRKGLLG